LLAVWSPYNKIGQGLSQFHREGLPQNWEGTVGNPDIVKVPHAHRQVAGIIEITKRRDVLALGDAFIRANTGERTPGWLVVIAIGYL